MGAGVPRSRPKRFGTFSWYASRNRYKNPWEVLPGGQPGEGLDRLHPPPPASEHLPPETVSAALGSLLCSSKLWNGELDGGNLWTCSSGRASEMPLAWVPRFAAGVWHGGRKSKNRLLMLAKTPRIHIPCASGVRPEETSGGPLIFAQPLARRVYKAGRSRRGERLEGCGKAG